MLESPLTSFGANIQVTYNIHYLVHIYVAHKEGNDRTQDDKEKRTGFHVKQLPEVNPIQCCLMYCE